MRNFEERKAEIFRRSESRISKRKKVKKYMLSACIPLSIMVVVSALTMLPRMGLQGKTNPIPENVHLQDSGIAENMVLPGATDKTDICTVEIIRIYKDDALEYDSQEYKLSSESAVKNSALYDTLEDMFTDVNKDVLHQNQVTQPEEQEDIVEEEVLFGSGDISSDYKIVFKIANGAKKEYWLRGYTLTRSSENQCITLTEAQYFRILEMLENLTIQKGASE